MPSPFTWFTKFLDALPKFTTTPVVVAPPPLPLSLSITKFLDALSLEGEQVPNVDNAISRSVERHRKDCHSGEYHLRRLFATKPGDPTVQDPYVGIFDIFSLPDQALLARPRDWNEPTANQFALDHEDTLYYFPQKYLLPISPHLRRVPGARCIVDDMSAFRRAWDVFSGGAFAAITNWKNIVVAGGSVLACLLNFPSNPSQAKLFKIYQSFPYKNSDIDLFLWGMTEDQAKAKMQEIFVAVSSAVPWDVICFRTKNTITIQGEYPKRPIQIVMRLYSSPAEILAGFDVDCCCVVYDGTNVFTNFRCLDTIIRQRNRIDVLRRSPSYEHRLAKYSLRGFEVYYPDLDRHRIDYVSMARPGRIMFPGGLGRLVMKELIRLNYERFDWLYVDPEDRDPSQPLTLDRLRHSNYDYAWVKIPYGEKWWSPTRVKEHVEYKAGEIMRYHERHRHVMTCGTMAECLDRCCDDPNVGNQAGDEADGFFSGPAVFIVNNPGRQTVGSFNPTDFGQWETGAYLNEYDATTAS